MYLKILGHKLVGIDFRFWGSSCEYTHLCVFLCISHRESRIHSFIHVYYIHLNMHLPLSVYICRQCFGDLRYKCTKLGWWHEEVFSSYMGSSAEGL